MLMRSAWRASLPLRRLVLLVLACVTGFALVTSASDVHDPEPSSSGHDPSDHGPAASSSFVGECSGEARSVQDLLLEAPDPAVQYIPSAIRAQRSPFLANPQGLDYGLPIKLVNSSRGNLTFQWRDLALPGHIPFIVGRVYDSDLARASGSAHPACTQDFGPGWRMLPSDHILMLPGGSRLEMHSSTGRSHGFFLAASGTFVPEMDAPDTPWDRILPLADGSLEARLPRGEVQTYRAGEEPGLYLLAERRDGNGHWLRLSWKSDRLIRLENDGGAHLEVAREVATQAAREAAPRMSMEESTVEPRGREVSPDRITALIDTARRTVTFRYDHAGRLVESVAPGGVVTRWSYDDGGRLAGASDAAGRSLLSTTYNRGARVEDLVMGGGRLNFDHDGTTRVTNVRNAPGARWQMNHDPEGRVVRLIDPMGFENAFAYDGSGNLVEHRDTQGKATRYRYSRHLVTAVDLPDGSSVAYAFDARARLLSHTDRQGSVTRFTHDERGNLLTVTDALGTRSGVYDDAGNLIELVDHVGRRTAFDYDSFGRIVAVEKPDGGRWLIEHDPRGPMTRITGPAGESLVVEYDAAGRAIAVVTPENVTEEATYDETDLLIAYSDRSGRRFELTYDEWRRLASVARLDAKPVGYEYDQRGLLSWIRRAGEPSTSYGHDARDELAFVRFSPGKLIVFTYDGQGRLTEAALKGYSSIVYRYDETGGLPRVLHNAAAGTIEPLGAGNFSSAGSSTGGLHMGHDERDPLLAAPRADPAGRFSPRDGMDGNLFSLLLDVGARREHWYEVGNQPLEVLALVRDLRALTSPGGVRDTQRDSDSGLSIETVDSAGPDDDPPIFDEGCPDPWVYCNATRPSRDPCCWGSGDPGGGVGGGGGDGGGGDGGDCTLIIMPTTVTTAPLSTVFFTAEANGCSTTPSWTAIGGSPSSGTGTSFEATYPTPSQVPFTVSVRADGITRNAQVYVIAPTCDFSVSLTPGSPYVGDPITFTATGNCVEYSWSAGSSACPSNGGTNPWTTKFLQIGSRTVNVAGQNGYGNLTVKPVTVSVLTCTTSILGPATTYEGESTCYSPSVTGGTSGTYTWSAPGGIPGGQIGSGTSFCTTFTAPGEYLVTLEFEKSVPGCSPVSCLGASKQVTVNPAPPPPPTVQINSTNPLAMLQGSTSSVDATGRDGLGSPVSGSYSWTTSNPAVLALTPNGSQVMLSGNSAGSSVLTVMFTTSGGSDTDQITVYVSELAIAGLTTTEPIEPDRRYVDLASPFLAEADPVAITASIIPDLPIDVTVTASVVPSGSGSFSPPQASASDQVTSTFSAAVSDLTIGGSATYLGYVASDGTVVDEIPTLLVEQELIRMMYGEGACRPSRERTGLAWVARNRIGDGGFNSPPGNSTLAQVIRQAGQFAGYWSQQTLVRGALADSPSRSAYDSITEEGGMVQQGLTTDLTLGSVGFVTPEDGDILALLAAFDRNDTVDAQDLVVQSPGFQGDYQAVLVQPRAVYEAAAAGPGACDNPFVYFRRKQPTEATVAFNP